MVRVKGVAEEMVVVGRAIEGGELVLRNVLIDVYLGWAKFMEWNYPVEVVVTSKKTFNAAGAVEAAASL